MSRLQKDPRLLVGVVAGAVVLLLAASWLLLLSPKRDKVVELDQSIAASQTELALKKDALARPSAAVKVRASDLFRLNKALPDKSDMSAIILDVNRLAAANKLSFSSIAPTAAIAGTGSIAQPVIVTVQGRFGAVSKFLGDLTDSRSCPRRPPRRPRADVLHHADRRRLAGRIHLPDGEVDRDDQRPLVHPNRAG